MEYCSSPSYIERKIQLRGKTYDTITDKEMYTIFTEIGYKDNTLIL